MKSPRLAIVQEKTAAGMGLPPDPAAKLEALRLGMRHEAQLAFELRDELLRQRAAVAAGDSPAVDRASDATSRLLLALDEAARRRGEIVATLTGDPLVPLAHLETQLGHPLPEPVERARLELRSAAQDVAREAAINRVVLRRAADAGEAFLQDLFSGGSPAPPAYGSATPPHPPSAAGRLIDRTA